MRWRLILCLTRFCADVFSVDADGSTATCTGQEHDTPSVDDVAMVQRAVKLKPSHMIGAIELTQPVRRSRGWVHRESNLQSDGAVVLHDKLTPTEEALLGFARTDAAASVTNQTNFPEDHFIRASDMKQNIASTANQFLAIVLVSWRLILLSILLFVAGQYFLPSVFAFRATGSNLHGTSKAKAQDAPFTWEPGESCIKWIHYSFAYNHEQLIETCGLDAAMLVAFTEMALEILMAVGLPFFVLGCPVYHYLGGMAAIDDTLSSFGIGNVVHGSFIYWPVACSTWLVVIFAQFRLFRWMRMFMKYREDWLMCMPAPQCLTILVEGIPADICSDDALKSYFQHMFGEGSVKEAFVVKKIANLELMIKNYKDCHRSLKEVIFQMKTSWKSRVGLQQEKLRCLLDMERLKMGIGAEQERIALEAQKSPLDTDIYATSGFVTFMEWRVCEQAIVTRLRDTDGTLMISRPPEPTDVIYSDLEQHGCTVQKILGHAALGSLLLASTFIAHGISAMWSFSSIEGNYVSFMSANSVFGVSKDMMPSLIPALGLTLIMSILPTLLSCIFNIFFNFKASRWAQVHLQTYYFWFMLVLVMFVTVVGRCFVGIHGQMLLSPVFVSVIFADRLPLTMDFYMNLVVLQWVTHAMNLTRYVNVMKYIIFKCSMEPEDARALSEPEDQDCCGTGSRSARFSLMFIMGLVFCSICPPLALLVCINFFICRLFYGYLIPYAEQRKSDLGGDHFALQLLHAHLGVLMYIIVMTVLLSHRAATYGPASISSACFLWWAISFWKFRTKMLWQSLPFEDVVSNVQRPKRESFAHNYQQRALDPEVLVGLAANLFEE